MQGNLFSLASRLIKRENEKKLLRSRSQESSFCRDKLLDEEEAARIAAQEIVDMSILAALDDDAIFVSDNIQEGAEEEEDIGDEDFNQDFVDPIYSALLTHNNGFQMRLTLVIEQ